MPVPCSRCRERKEDCLVDLETGCCSMCASRRVKCDVITSVADWDLLHVKRAKALEKLLAIQGEADSLEDKQREEEEKVEDELRLSRERHESVRQKHKREKDALRRKRRRLELELEVVDQDRALTLHRNLKVLDDLEEFAENRDKASEATMAPEPGDDPILPLCPAGSLFPSVGSQEDWDFLLNYPEGVPVAES